MSRPGLTYSSDQHQEILLQLDEAKIEKLYQEKFAQLFREQQQEENSKSPEGTKRSIMLTNSEPNFNRPPKSPMAVRSLTAPPVNQFSIEFSLFKPISFKIQEAFDTQSVRSFGEFSEQSSPSPASSRQGTTTKMYKKKVKKTSLPAQFSFTPMLDEAMSIAAEQFGNKVDVSSVRVVKAEDKPIRRKKSLINSIIQKSPKSSADPMEIRFTFNPNARPDSVVEEDEPETSVSPPPKYSVCTASPVFSVTVTDADEDVCPIDIEGMEFGNAENEIPRPKLESNNSLVSDQSKALSTIPVVFRFSDLQKF